MLEKAGNVLRDEILPGRARFLLFMAAAGIVTGFLYASGESLDGQDTLDLLDKAFYWKWILYGVTAGGISGAVWLAAARINAGRPAAGKVEPAGRRALSGHLLYTGILFVCWMPAFLSLVPGAFSYDAYAEWEQVRTGCLNSHHPVLHVLLAGGLAEGFYRMTGSYNIGIGVYTIVQMLFLANILALSIRFLEKRGIGRRGRLAALLFYGFSPVFQLFSICATKDVIFAAFELLFFMSVLLLAENKERFFTGAGPRAVFMAAAFGTMVFRNNGLVIVLLMLPVLFFFCGKFRRRFILPAAGILMLYGFYAGPVYQMLSVAPGGIEEMLSVPIQQMARVYRYDHASLAPEDLELLYRAVPRENLEAYKPTVADPVKSGFDREGYEANKKELAALWVRWGMEHPLTYINSFLVGTVDFWYPGGW